MAAAYFVSKGYEILFQNWRNGHWEVDIIASHEKILHFIEVKCRSNSSFGHPEESVSKQKISNLLHAAEAYCNEFDVKERLQFDVLAITLAPDGNDEYFLIEDVYL